MAGFAYVTGKDHKKSNYTGMNGFERITAAMNGRPADKTPVMLHNFMMAAHEAGVTMEQYRNDPEVISSCFIRSVETYGYDGIVLDIDTATLAGAAGVPVDYPENESARVVRGRLTDISEVPGLPPVDIESFRYVQVWLEAARRLKEHFGDEVYIRGNCDQAPFSLAAMLRGIQDMMVDLILAPEEQVKELLEYATEITCQFVRLMAQTGVHMISNGDSIAGPEMISADMYEKFAVPYERKVADTARGLNLPYALHICGNADFILGNMVKTGADAFELDYRTDAALARRLFDDKAVFIGNIDPSGVLALGDRKQVEEKTAGLLSVFSGSNRFILNAGCAIPPETPPDNIRAMIETARAHDAG